MEEGKGKNKKKERKRIKKKAEKEKEKEFISKDILLRYFSFLLFFFPRILSLTLNSTFSPLDVDE